MIWNFRGSGQGESGERRDCGKIRAARVLLGGLVGRRYLSDSRSQIPEAQGLVYLEGNKEFESGRAEKRIMVVWF